MLVSLKGIVSWSLFFLYRFCADLSKSLFWEQAEAIIVLYCSFVDCMLPGTAIAIALARLSSSY
jgi:hypothetical protein